MQNIITVPAAFKSACKLFANTRKHIYRVFNVTANVDLTPYIAPGSLETSSAEKSDKGLSRSDSFKFEIKVPNINPPTVMPETLVIATMDSGARGFESVLMSNPSLSGIDMASTDLITDYVTMSSLNAFVLEGDTITLEDTFNGTTICLYTGFARKTKTYENNINNGIQVTVNDKLFDGVKARIKEETVLIDKWLCKNADKENSLAHILAYKMGFSDSTILFDDVKIGTTYAKAAYSIWEKDTKALAELTVLAEAVHGKVYCNNEGKLVFSNPYDAEDYTDVSFTLDTNIKGEPAVVTTYPVNDVVKVTYDDFRLMPETEVWKLASTDNSKTILDDANWSIDPLATTDWYRATYIADICVDLSLPVPVAYTFVNAVKTMVALQYEVKTLSSTEFVFRFVNSLNTVVWIEKFKVLGKPVFKIEGNEVSYTEVKMPIEPLLLSNKYIQDNLLASTYAKYAYIRNCKTRSQVKLKVVPATFLALTNKVSLKTPKMPASEPYVVIGYSHKADYTELTLDSYVPATFLRGDTELLVASPVDVKAVTLANTIAATTVVVSNEVPIQVPNLAVSGKVGGIAVNWTTLDRQDIKGYFVEYKEVATGTKATMFTQSNNHWMYTDSRVSYTVTVWAVTLKNVAGEKQTVSQQPNGQPVKSLQPIEEAYVDGAFIPESKLRLEKSTASLFAMLQNLDPQNIVINLDILTTKVNSLINDGNTEGRVIDLERGVESIATRLQTVEGPEGITGLQTKQTENANELTSQALAAHVPTEFYGVVAAYSGVTQCIIVDTDLRLIPYDAAPDYKLILQKTVDGTSLYVVDVNAIVINMDNGVPTIGGKIYFSRPIDKPAPVATTWSYRLGRPKLVGSTIQQTANEISQTVYGVGWDDKDMADTDIASVDMADPIWSNRQSSSVYSTISQVANTINLRVSNNEDSFSDLTMTVDGITLSVESLNDDMQEQFTVINQRADSIALAVTAATSDIGKQISAIVLDQNSITAAVTTFQDEVAVKTAQIELSIEGVTQSVLNNSEDADSKFSLINQRADSIEYSVADISLDLIALDGTTTTNFSLVNQRADSISLSANQTASSLSQLREDITVKNAQIDLSIEGIVSTVTDNAKGANIVSSINQTAAAVTISANKIKLGAGLVAADGSVTFNADDMGGLVIVNNKVRIGSLSADKIESGALISNVNPLYNFIDLDSGDFSFGNADSHISYDNATGIMALKGALTLDGDTDTITFEDSGWSLKDYNDEGWGDGLVYTAIKQNLNTTRTRNIKETNSMKYAGSYQQNGIRYQYGAKKTNYIQVQERDIHAGTTTCTLETSVINYGNNSYLGSSIPVRQQILLQAYADNNMLTQIMVKGLKVGYFDYSGNVTGNEDDGCLSFHNNALWVWKSGGWKQVVTA